MNHVLHAGAESAQMVWMGGFTTVAFMATMVGWTLWAWAPSNRQAMEDAAKLPFDDGGAL